jgi:thioredoxin-like negative regulator of GroEL
MTPGTALVALDPHSPLACFASAKDEIQAQRVESAITLLETAVSVLPEFTDALGLLAEQYIRLGKVRRHVRQHSMQSSRRHASGNGR